MSVNIDTLYYEPVREKIRAEGTRGVAVLDSNFFIKAQFDATPFSDGKPTPNGFPHLLEGVPFLARHGFVNICSSMVLYESASMFPDCSSSEKFFFGTERDGILNPFFRACRSGDWLSVLPPAIIRTESERNLQKLWQVCQLDASFCSASKKRTSAINLKPLPDAGEISTEWMMRDLVAGDPDLFGNIPVFYVSNDNLALSRMTSAGYCSLSLMRFVEGLRCAGVLPVMGLPQERERAFVEALTAVGSRPN